MLVGSGTILIKYWFTVSNEEQERRFQARIDEPTKRWKLSPMDLEARERWAEPFVLPPRTGVGDYARPPMDQQTFVPDVVEALLASSG